MAITGVVLVAFVVVHMAANLQMFAGAAQIDGYARALRRAPVLLWAVRTILLVSFLVHVYVGVELARVNRAARPVKYRRRPSVVLDQAGPTMIWSGLFIGLFVLVHLANLTWGNLHPAFVHLQVYGNVTRLLSRAPWAVFYLAALGVLAAHMAHGTRSMFRSAGVAAAPNHGPVARFAVVLTTVVVAGLAAVVIGVMTHQVR